MTQNEAQQPFTGPELLCSAVANLTVVLNLRAPAKTSLGGRQRPVEESKNHRGGLRKPHLDASSTYCNCFWPFFTQLEENFGTSCLVLTQSALKWHSKGDKSLLNRVKTTRGESENHILMLLLPVATVFGLFFTQLEENFGASCLVLTPSALKWHSEGDKSLLNRVKNTRGGLRKPHLDASSTYCNCFWPFSTQLEENFGASCLVFDLIGTKMAFGGRQKPIGES